MHRAKRRTGNGGVECITAAGGRARRPEESSGEQTAALRNWRSARAEQQVCLDLVLTVAAAAAALRSDNVGGGGGGGGAVVVVVVAVAALANKQERRPR